MRTHRFLRGSDLSGPVLVILVTLVSSVCAAQAAGAAAEGKAGGSAERENRPCQFRENDVLAPYRKISWEDYKGKRPRSMGPAAARIQAGIELKSFEVETKKEGDVWVVRAKDICLYSFLDKFKSFYQADVATSIALAHGQGHFDLTEAFTRRLYWTLVGLEARNSEVGLASAELRSRISAEYQKALREWQAMEDLYDKETGHGGYALAQRKWKKKIRGLLATKHAGSTGG
ncbi:MAG: hypothetical protein K0U98_17780 [Deltaproteobacteria bacterium]|nr:hypothetical protein [Deltaproteobacteria bacterium]